MSSPLDHAAPTRCENCGALLQGRFCARCGQSVINPVRHAGHALEEVFESFWHLDGRVFRTLRDLLVPARVACSYLAGHRARYIAPLRLFVILSVLTFFVAQVTIQLDQDTVLLRNDVVDTQVPRPRWTAPRRSPRSNGCAIWPLRKWRSPRPTWPGFPARRWA